MYKNIKISCDINIKILDFENQNLERGVKFTKWNVRYNIFFLPQHVGTNLAQNQCSLHRWKCCTSFPTWTHWKKKNINGYISGQGMEAVYKT